MPATQRPRDWQMDAGNLLVGMHDPLAILEPAGEIGGSITGQVDQETVLIEANLVEPLRADVRRRDPETPY